MKKRKRGRPKLDVRRVKLTTTLSPATIKWLKVFGISSISKAIEDLVKSELRRNGEFWEKLAKVKGSWDESMEREPDLPTRTGRES
jgi:hypothetical protein